jgi:hypothetical protein
MNDDDLPNLVRSGTDHSVSVSELTGNAKNPINMVVSHEQETEARKREFEKQALAALEAKKALIAALAEHKEHVAPTDDGQDTNIQKVTSDKAAVNIQNVNTDGFETNIQKVSTDKIRDNIQTVGNNIDAPANVQNVSVDAIVSNLQKIGSGNIATNRQNIVGEKAIETNRQGIPSDVIAPNVQDIGEQSLGGKTNLQVFPQDDASSNRQALSQGNHTQNNAKITFDTSGHDEQKIAKLGIQNNRQSLEQGELTKNSQTVALSPGLGPNNQSVNSDAPSLNRQGVNNEKITSHFEPLPSDDVERKKVDLSAPQDKGRSSAVRNKANGARAPMSETERQQASLNKNSAMDAFHGRLAGIKQNVDTLNSRLTDLEEKVHTDEAKIEKGNPKDFKVD